MPHKISKNTVAKSEMKRKNVPSQPKDTVGLHYKHTNNKVGREGRQGGAWVAWVEWGVVWVVLEVG